MSEQPNHGQPNQQPPYPYSPPPPAQPQQQPYPYPPQQQQGYQGPPPQQQQQPYQNPYPQQQQPYGQPPQQYGAPQGYPQQQPYPQVPPQQYPGPGQQPYGQPYGQPGQQPGQPGQLGLQPDQLPPGSGLGPDQAQAGKKPKKKRSGCATFFLVVFSPLIALAFVVYGIYWVLAWLLTPVALVVHLVFCGLGLIWYSGVKVLASGRSKYRLFQPLYPKFPPLWTGKYWVGLNRTVRSTVEGLAGILEFFNW